MYILGENTKMYKKLKSYRTSSPKSGITKTMILRSLLDTNCLYNPYRIYDILLGTPNNILIERRLAYYQSIPTSI